MMFERDVGAEMLVEAGTFRYDLAELAIQRLMSGKFFSEPGFMINWRNFGRRRMRAKRVC